MKNKHYIFRTVRKILRKNPYTDAYQQYKGQEANDYVYEKILYCIENKQGLMVSKFGTIELDNYICDLIHSHKISIDDYINAIRGEYSIHKSEAFHKLCNNAGFFPEDISLLKKYCNMVEKDIPQIDILASYIKAERLIENKLNTHCVKIDLDGYYAPFLWNNPWTRVLKGKKVLVIHPFVKSIQNQYQIRDKLFENPDVLPEFSQLILIEAVQSIAGNTKNLQYRNWFEALEAMKKKMDSCDYDIALIGCGAYGMHLCAHAKRNNKVAIQLAGWTQMLFGIYGKRWIEDQPQYSRFINNYWKRPLETERPKNLEKVENGAYW